MKHRLAKLVINVPVLVTVVSFALGCHETAQQNNQQQLKFLSKGDYLREDYVRALCESRSPLAADIKIGAGDPQEMNISSDKDVISLTPGYNFHETGGPLIFLNDGSIQMDEYDKRRFVLHVQNAKSFSLVSGKLTLQYEFVGDWYKWANDSLVAGTYVDKQGRRYVFQEDGQAVFPDMEPFDYQLVLDEVLNGYDTIRSGKLKSPYGKDQSASWSVRIRKDGIEMHDLDYSNSDNDPDGVESLKARWNLKRLTPLNCH